MVVLGSVMSAQPQLDRNLEVIEDFWDRSVDVPDVCD